MEGERSDDPCVSWEDDPLTGIIPRALANIFDALTNQEVEFSVRVSFLELYNEELFDLLGSSEDPLKLRIYEDSARKVNITIIIWENKVWYICLGGSVWLVIMRSQVWSKQGPAIFLFGLIVKFFLWSFFPFQWFKKGKSWLTTKRTKPAQEKWLGKLTNLKWA